MVGGRKDTPTDLPLLSCPLCNWWVCNHGDASLISVSTNYFLCSLPGSSTWDSMFALPMAGTAGQGWERRLLTGLCMGGEQRPKSRGGRENAGSCWTSSLFSPGVVKPRTASHFSSAYFGLLATLAVASQMKSTLHSPYGGKNLVNWMHTALHTHCVLAPGPAVLQTLAKWEAFCAVEKKYGQEKLDSGL